MSRVAEQDVSSKTSMTRVVHTDVDSDLRLGCVELRLLRPLREPDSSRLRRDGFSVLVSIPVPVDFSGDCDSLGVCTSSIGMRQAARMMNDMKKNVPAAATADRRGKRVRRPLEGIVSQFRNIPRA